MGPVFSFFLSAAVVAAAISLLDDLPPVLLVAQPSQPTSHIIILGSVYCDACCNDTFSTHSYFLQGANVQVQCKFKASAPGTAEQIAFSVNRSTDDNGVYKLDIPSVDRIDCVKGPPIQYWCQASLLGSSSPACSVPGFKNTSVELVLKSRQDNVCIYSFSALNYRPIRKNFTLCRDGKNPQFPLNSSKFFLPYYPPRGLLPWPLPQIQFPPFPPLPSLPFPPILPFPKPPGFSFPFPPIPPIPNPPAFKNPGNPQTFIPNVPSVSLLPPPPPAFDLGDPRTWVPNVPSDSPLPPFDVGDPRTWIYYVPPSPPENPSNQQP